MNTRAANSYTTTFGYVAGGHGTKSTTPLVASITQPGMNYSYTYDNRGNITSETRNGSTTTYVYDGLGQLTRVNDPHENATWVYNYDRGGNITSKVKYAYTTGTLGTAHQTIGYTYGDSNWKDKLTSYDGKTLEYDDIGNPTNDGTWAYSWSAGRQLAAMEKESTLIEFKYDHNGLRTQKSVTSNNVTTTTNYTYHGKQLTHMTKGSDTLHFFYDSNSRPAFVKFNGTMYRYVYNLHGDIVGIVDGNNTLVVEYKYSAWGMPISTTGSMAGTLGTLNPFRYCSYVYDTESGLYHLQSRYYNPQIQRFINSDAFISEEPDLLITNLYAYCLNAPVNNADDEGTWSLPNWAKVAIGTVLIVGAAVVATVATGGVACFAAGAAIGAAKGAISGAVGGAISGVIQNRIETGSWEGSLEAAVDGAADGFLSGAIGGFITGGITSNACFIAGTLVHAECGLVPIEEIQADQMVWAEEPETGERALKRVVRTFLNEKDELVHVQVNSETITCTTEHPFYVQGKGWVAAKDLKLGDKLELQNGDDAFVDAIRREKLSEPIPVFNFEVEDFHTYYVGAGCVLVHNQCQRGVGGKGWEGDSTWKQNVKTVQNGGTITSLKGGIPNRNQGVKLIAQAGGKVLRIEAAHLPPNPHNYPHINYLTRGIRSALRITELE